MDIEKNKLMAGDVPYAKPSVTAGLARRRPRLNAFLFFAAFALLAYNMITTVGSISSNPRSTSDDLRPDASMGIALTPTYGTIAVRNDRGVLRKILKVPGNDEYIAMMKRLSKDKSRHPSQPYGSIGEMLRDWPRQFLRNSRKKLGMPASADVATLAEMIHDLVASVANLPYPINGAGAILAFPTITALYEEDANDALEYLNIHSLLGTHIISHVPYAIDAAFSGYGLGMCEHWQDRDTCRAEHDKLPGQRTLVIDYSRRTLSIDFTYMRVASGNYVPPLGVEVDFEAGSDSKEADNEAHSDRIKADIRNMIARKAWKSVDLVLLTGESATDEDFLNTVRKAVDEYNPDIHLDDEPELVPAKGVSELAYRALEIYKMAGS